MNVLRWIVINGFFVLIAWVWLGLGHESAGAFLIVFSWVLLFAGFVSISDKVVNQSIENGNTKQSVPALVAVVFEMCFTVVFIIGEAPLAAVAYFLHAILTQAHYKLIEYKLKESK